MERSLTNNGAEAVNSALRSKTGAWSCPKLCIRQLQQDVEYTAGMYEDITSGVDVDQNQVRFEKKQAENRERLEIAKAYNAEEPERFFLRMKKYTRLSGYKYAYKINFC